MSNLYGYVRVSSKDQNEDRQLLADGIAAAKLQGSPYGTASASDTG